MRRGAGRALALAALAGAACATAPAASPAVRRPEPEALVLRVERPDGPGPFPAVILLHGCSGPHRKDRDWARWLAGEGYVAVVTDSFGPRGVKSVCGTKDRGAPTSRDRAEDAAAVRRHLAALPFVDPARVGLMGFSHGGKTALRAAVRGAGAPDRPFAAVVALYPPCFRLRRDMAIQSPLAILIGADDDWALADRCQAFTAAARSRGQEVSLTVYPGALHGFDAVGLDTYRLGHHLRYDPAAHADAQVRVRAFLAEWLRK
ncbi:MAG: dienelactone hydrolase family protein [Deltaproteobacteria bacterium]|nr:dienelactone hydrolase family protein [Deltaproteobacteria bacterium]